MGSAFGQLFRITTFGESHGGGIGVVIDGCPPKIVISQAEIQRELDRRRPGQSKITSQRQEEDRCEILSGIFEGKTLGTPIGILVRNKDARPQDYAAIKEKFRPSHADFTYEAKYGIRNWQGGGRASARETVGRVAGAAVAKQVFKKLLPKLEVVGFVQQVHKLVAEVDPNTVKFSEIEGNIVRWPSSKDAARVIRLIERVRNEGDSLGGVVACVVRGMPVGLGEPVFDKLEADLAKAVMSLPASKGFEIGSGFAGTDLRGSQHNDAFYMDAGRVRTRTNRSGGVQGGITNGETIFFRVAFKPTATIMREQHTVSVAHEDTTITGRGRHDPCVLPRAVPMVEAMTTLVLADHALRHLAITADAK